MLKDFYRLSSHTSKNIILTTENQSGKRDFYATLEQISITSNKDFHNFYKQKSDWNGSFLITSEYGKHKREKLESCHFKEFDSALSWLDFVQNENPKKIIKIWKIIKF